MRGKNGSGRCDEGEEKGVKKRSGWVGDKWERIDRR